MGYDMGDGIKIFKVNCVLLFVLISFPVSRCTNTSTVCYGASSLPCTTHRLSCPSPLVIQIINTSYGYRPRCNENSGISDCTNTTCCNEEPGDCFIPFSFDDKGNCSGVETCTLSGFRALSASKCGTNISAYSKIQYDCVIKGSNITTSTQTTYSQTHTKASTGITTFAQTTVKGASEVTQTPDENTATSIYSTDLTVSSYSKPQYSTDLTVSTSSSPQCPHCPLAQSDNSGIVGGVLGTLLIISVIINVGLVVYFTRKMKSLSSTPRENNYDGLTNIGLDQTPTTYDALQVQSTASSNHDDKKKSDSSHTYYNTKGDSLSRDINPYYENMKRP